MGGVCSVHLNKKKAHTTLVGETEWKRLLRRCRRRWEKNIKTDLKETGWEDTNWIRLAEYRVQ